MRRWLILTLVALPAFAQEAVAQTTEVKGPNLQDVLSARSYAMGNAFRAHGYGADALLGNPAALSVFRRYQVEATGAWDIDSNFGAGSLTIADSQTSELAAGISYQLVSFGGDEARRTAHLTTTAMALAISSWLHVGMSARHQVITGASETNSVTMSAGVIFRPWEYLSVGVSGHNLIGVANVDVPRYMVVSVSSMISLLTPMVEFKMDFAQPEPRYAFSAGVEWIAGEVLPLRVGYSYDGIVEDHFLGFGIGYFVQGSGIDLAYRHAIDGKGHLLAATIKLQF